MMTSDSTSAESTSTPSDQAMDTFVQMSALLTGFSAAVLAPTLDPTDLKTAIFDLAEARTGSAFTDLLSEYQDLVAQIAPGKTVDEMTEAEKIAIGRSLLDSDGGSGDSQSPPTARAVIKAWYLGSWYQPFDYAGFSSGSQIVISDQAYIQGLAWKAMQSHAMGNSTWTFGYWQSPPPDLTDFTGGNPILDPDSSSSADSADSADSEGSGS